MFGSAVLEVLIGLVVVFCVLSVVCSGLNETWASLFAARGRTLHRSVVNLLGKDGAARFFAHPRIRALSPPPSSTLLQRLPRRLQDRLAALRLPSYVADATFAEVVLDLLAPVTEQHDDERLLRLHRLAATIPPGAPALDAQLPALLQRAELATRGDANQRSAVVLEAVRSELANCFHEVGDRATGWYRRRAQWMALVFAVPIVLLTNADAIRLAKVMYQQPALRAQMATLGEQLAAQGPKPDAPKPPETPKPPKAPELDAGRQQLQALVERTDLPLGWPEIRFEPNGDRTEVSLVQAIQEREKLVGLLLSVLAASLGAPFWFQLLNKLVSLRSAGKAGAEAPATPTPPAATGESGSQPTADATAATTDAGSAAAATAAAVSRLDEPYWERAQLAGSAATTAAQRPQARAIGGRQAADIALALDCARLSALVYRDLEAAAQIATRLGCSNVGAFDRSGTQALTCTRDGNLFVCYRGTEPRALDDWITDAKFKLVDAGPDERLGAGRGKVHAGFVNALRHTRDLLEQVMVASTDVQRVVFTGHSLGAALATLHCRRWLASQHRKSPVALVTFGSPRVGNQEFCQDLAAALDGQGTAQRWVNNRDIVTRVPPRANGYTHLEPVHFFDERGELKADSADWFRWLADAIDAANDLKGAAGRAVADHGIERYVARLEAAFALAIA